jgi:hypothetical protein
VFAGNTLLDRPSFLGRLQSQLCPKLSFCGEGGGGRLLYFSVLFLALVVVTSSLCALATQRQRDLPLSRPKATIRQCQPRGFLTPEGEAQELSVFNNICKMLTYCFPLLSDEFSIVEESIISQFFFQSTSLRSLIRITAIG